MPEVAPVMPTLRYRDAHAAIDLLVNAFGFERNAVFESDGAVDHAQLTFGTGMVMLGSAREGDDFSNLGPVSIYVIVDDADEHHARAVANDADIVTPVEDQDYGGRLYTARDGEGNLWSFGTYRPEL